MPAKDRIYTAFKVDGALWQWKGILFGLYNAVPCFQRIIDKIIKSNNCNGTFLAVDKSHNLTFNESKCIYNTDTVNLLGYRIKNGSFPPDLARVKILQDRLSSNNREEQ